MTDSSRRKNFRVSCVKKDTPKRLPLTLLLQPDVCFHIIAGWCLQQGALLMDLQITTAIFWPMCVLNRACIHGGCQGAPRGIVAGTACTYWKATESPTVAEPLGILLPHRASVLVPAPLLAPAPHCLQHLWLNCLVSLESQMYLKLEYNLRKFFCLHLQSW